jgi:signal transduction histidine kinase
MAMHTLPGIPNYPKIQKNQSFLLTVEEIQDPMSVIENFFDHYTNLQNIREELERFYTATLLPEVPNDEPFIIYNLYKDVVQLIESVFILKQNKSMQTNGRKTRSNKKMHNQYAEELEVEFLDFLAHEIRVQFSALPVLIQGLLSDAEKNDLKAVRTEAKYISAVAEDIMRVIQNMKETAQYKKGKLVFNKKVSTFYLEDWILNVAAPFCVIAFSQGKDLILYQENVKDKTIRHGMKTDAVKLKQILQNLLSNALKFSNAGEDVSLTLLCVDDKIVFLVRNPGIIPAERLPLLFEPYAVIEVGKAATGLGLHLSRMYAELLGGTLEIYNEDDAHTVAKLVIPSSIS